MSRLVYRDTERYPGGLWEMGDGRWEIGYGRLELSGILNTVIAQ